MDKILNNIKMETNERLNVNPYKKSEFLKIDELEYTTYDGCCMAFLWSRARMSHFINLMIHLT